jgi:hypothetical protein
MERALAFWRKSMSTCTYRGVVSYETNCCIDGALLRYLESERRKLMRENAELKRDAEQHSGKETIV